MIGWRDHVCLSLCVMRPLAYLVRCWILSQWIRCNVHAWNDTIQTPNIATNFVIVMRCHAQHGRGNKVRLYVIQLRLVLICGGSRRRLDRVYNNEMVALHSPSGCALLRRRMHRQATTMAISSRMPPPAALAITG